MPVPLCEARFPPEKHRFPRRRPAQAIEGGEARTPMRLSSIGIRRAEPYCASCLWSLQGWLHYPGKSYCGPVPSVEGSSGGALGEFELYSARSPSDRKFPLLKTPAKLLGGGQACDALSAAQVRSQRSHKISASEICPEHN